MPIDNSTRFPKPLAADLRELSEGMAIVIDGDTAPKAIASGQYLFIKNHSTLATGGYHATAAIASGADITSSNVTPDADGIVNGAFSSLSEHLTNLVKSTTANMTFDSSGMFYSVIPSTKYCILQCITANGALVLPYSYQDKWYFKALSPGNMSPYGSTVTVTIYYIHQESFPSVPFS